MARTLRTITVEDLIALLKEQDPEARVIVTADYGDHCHTAQALPLKGECDTITLTKTAYSSSGFAITDDDEDAQDLCDPDETFLVLR